MRAGCVAVIAMPGDGVGAIDRLIAFGGQKVGLGQLRPAGEILLLQAVDLAYLLKADDVRAHFVEHAQDARRIAAPVGADALVDVVARDLEGLWEAARHARAYPAASRLALPPAAVVSMQVTRSVAKRAR